MSVLESTYNLLARQQNLGAKNAQLATINHSIRLSACLIYNRKSFAESTVKPDAGQLLRSGREEWPMTTLSVVF